MCFLFQNQTLHRKQYGHKSEIDCGKQDNILLGLLRVVLLVLGEGDETCQGSNEGSQTADIDCRKQACVVCGKVGQKYGARHVTDALTGQDTEEQCVHWQQFSEEIAHCRDACQVSAEYEKGTEGGKERVVYFLNGLPIHKQQNNRDYQSAPVVRNDTEHNQNTGNKQNRVNHGSS